MIERPRKLLLVVDAPSLLHRNHHAHAHTRTTDRSGRPAWALHGMLRQILEAIDSLLDCLIGLHKVSSPGY